MLGSVIWRAVCGEDALQKAVGWVCMAGDTFPSHAANSAGGRRFGQGHSTAACCLQSWQVVTSWKRVQIVPRERAKLESAVLGLDFGTASYFTAAPQRMGENGVAVKLRSVWWDQGILCLHSPSSSLIGLQIELNLEILLWSLLLPGRALIMSAQRLFIF